MTGTSDRPGRTVPSSMRCASTSSHNASSTPSGPIAVSASKSASAARWAAEKQLDRGGEVDTALSLSVEDGRITRMYAMRNPHKLAGLNAIATLTRN
jgi:RNA polymerase sigma-70 factor, ECF subfamily